MLGVLWNSPFKHIIVYSVGRLFEECCGLGLELCTVWMLCPRLNCEAFLAYLWPRVDNEEKRVSNGA